MNENFLTGTQVILRIVTIIAVVEFTIMDGFIFLNPDLSPYAEATLDTFFLAALATPLLYAWVINPYVVARDNALTELEQLNHIDLLTNLLNRRDIYHQLDHANNAAAEQQSSGAVMLMDLTGIKHINDTYGLEAGDGVLVETAQRLLSRIKVANVAGRMSGDEFVIIIHQIHGKPEEVSAKAMSIANEIIQHIAEPIDFNGQTLNVNASIGIKLFGSGTPETKQIIHDAGIAMQQARLKGKGYAELFNMNQPA